MFVVIIKPFDGYVQGAVVDASGWRNRQRMLDTRIVRAATADEIARATKTTKKPVPA